jgi:hypothetical protein
MPAAFRLILATLCLLAGANAANAQTEFYRAPVSEAAGAPGTLVRQEVIDGAPLGATTYRVLYRSIGLDDKPILVSGVVIVPPGDPPPGGRGRTRLQASCRAARRLWRSFCSSRFRGCVRSCATAT